jgi:hypothetical protein
MTHDRSPATCRPARGDPNEEGPPHPQARPRRCLGARQLGGPGVDPRRRALAAGRHLRLTALQQLLDRLDGPDVDARRASGSQAQRAPSRWPPHRHRGHAPGPGHAANRGDVAAHLQGDREPTRPPAQSRPPGRRPAADGFGIAASGSTEQSRPTSGASSRPRSSCRLAVTTGTPTTSRLHVGAGPGPKAA